MSASAARDVLACQKDQFHLSAGVHYLNCAYMSPLPRVSEEAGIAGLRLKRDPSGIRPADFFETSDEIRGLFAALVGAAEPERVAIGPGVSYAVAVAARNLPLERGQRVVLTHEQFPGDVHAWTRRAREVGAEVTTVAPPDTGPRGAGWNERLLEAIDARTAVVAVPTVHWTDGTRFDLERVSSRCRDVGAALVVDGTQSVGALPFDVSEVRPDVLMCATYKWLLGPYSVGLAYFSERFDDGVPLEETWIGRAGSEDFQRLVDYTDAYQPGAIRYDVSERSNFALLPIVAASLRLVDAWRPERVQAYCAELGRELFREVAELGFGVEGEDARGAHLFGLRMPAGIDLASLSASLGERKVSVSLRGNALRVSPNAYNDESDVGALLEVLREAALGA